MTHASIYSAAPGTPTLTAGARSGWWLPALLGVPPLIAALSWAGGGITAFTDLAFLLASAVLFGTLLLEVYRFPRHFAVGTMMFAGGSLIWICHDYLSHWFTLLGGEYAVEVSTVGIAKGAVINLLFLCFVAVGLHLPVGRVPRIFNWVPEPHSRSFYFGVVLFLFALSMIPYLFFATEPFFYAIYRSILVGRSGSGGAGWTVGRSGSSNYNWGAYIVVLFHAGQVGAVLAVFYTVLVSRSLFQTVVCWGIFLLHLALAFGTGTRGGVVELAVPAVAVIFLRYQAQAALYLRRFSVRAYIFSGATLFVLIVLVQTQALFRDTGFENVELDAVVGSPLRDNTMFSAGTPIFELVPDKVPFFRNRFIFEGWVRFLPETIYTFVIHPIPRALWHGKPVDEAKYWITELVMGRGAIDRGGSITPGIANEFYAKYGFAGVIQGGLLFGWIFVVCERGLKQAGGRLMPILLSLAALTFLFRTYRTFEPSVLWPLIIGSSFVWLAVTAFNITNRPAAARA